MVYFPGPETSVDAEARDNMAKALDGIRNGVRYIEEHLRQSFIMESAAEASGYSLYHFCRLFALAAGTPPGEYARKRRLSEAARDLACTDEPIGCIAREYSFQSHEAFTRSFKALFGLSPERYRRQTVPIRAMKPFVLMEEYRITDPVHLAEPPRVVFREETAIAGCSFLCDLSVPDLSERIEEHWQRTNPALAALPPALASAERYGIGWPVDRREEEPVLEYLAGRALRSPARAPRGFRTFILPRGEYLKAVHRGSPRAERETFLYLYGAFLPASGYGVSGAFDFDVYTDRFNREDPENPQSEVDIYIPVEAGAPEPER